MSIVDLLIVPSQQLILPSCHFWVCSWTGGFADRRTRLVADGLPTLAGLPMMSPNQPPDLAHFLSTSQPTADTHI